MAIIPPIDVPVEITTTVEVDAGWFQREPVLIFLGSVAGIVEAVLLALIGLDVLTWTPDQSAKVVGAVAIIAAALIATIRAIVVSPATDAQRTAEGMASMVPGQLLEAEGVPPLDVRTLAILAGGQLRGGTRAPDADE